MEFLVLLIVVSFLIYLYQQSKKKNKEIKNLPLELPVRISVDYSSEPSKFYPETRDVVETEDEGWILNPNSTFPLTIYGVNKETIYEIKKILDEGFSKSYYETEKKLHPIVARTNLRCKEIDEYVNKFKPQYRSKIEELIQNTPEWNSLGDKDKQDLLSSFKKIAIESLDVRPYCDLEALFDCEPIDATIDDALIDKYGFDNIKFYFRYANNINKVRIIPSDSYERPGFEKLVDLGLARRGTDIPFPEILNALKLKELNELVKDLDVKPFTRKDKSIEFLLTLPDIHQRLSKVVAFRELFQLKPLPKEFENLDVSKISENWKYTSQITFLIVQTYFSGCNEFQRYQNSLNSISIFKGWEIKAVNDSSTCPYCQRASSKTYPTTQRPKVPLHIGCRCTVIAKL